MGITTVIFPAGNEPDLEDFPKELRDEMHFMPVHDIRDALAIALEPAETESNQHGPGRSEGLPPGSRPAVAND